MPKTKSINQSATDLPPPLVGAFQSTSGCSSTHLRQVASCSTYARRASATVRQPHAGFVMKRLPATISFGDPGVYRPAALCPASTTADSAISGRYRLRRPDRRLPRLWGHVGAVGRVRGVLDV